MIYLSNKGGSLENKNGNEQLKIDKASIIRCAMELLQEKGIKKLSI